MKLSMCGKIGCPLYFVISYTFALATPQPCSNSTITGEINATNAITATATTTTTLLPPPKSTGTRSLTLERATVTAIISTRAKTTSTALNTTATTTLIPTDDGHRCTYWTQQYCHPFIRNTLVLYTGTGGWVMLCLIVCGVLFELHYIISGHKESYPQFRRDDLRHILKKQHSFHARYAAEVGLVKNT